MNHLPKVIPRISSGKPADKSIHLSPILAEVAQLEKSEVFARMKTSPEGLGEDEAARRWAEVGPNVVADNSHRGWLRRLLTATRNPLVILLAVLATISFATGDARAGIVMTLMVILGVMLRFVQETRAGVAAEKLKAMIKVTAAVVRGGKEEEIPLHHLVPGDVVELSAGDMIPADVRLIVANDLFVSQGTAKPPATAWLTGSPEERFDRVALQLRGFDMGMFEVSYRYTELYWAGQDKNWDYAKYQCEKIQHVIELAMERRTNRAPSAMWFLTNAIPPMMAAIQTRESARFQSQFPLFTASCNTCHAMEKMPFVTVQTPEHRLSPVRFNLSAQTPKP